MLNHVKRPKEILGLLLLLILGLAPRLAFVSRFPTIPVSDFYALVAFGQAIHDHGLISNGWFWLYSPGAPLVLSGLFRILPGMEPATVARLATAFACGLLPIVPFLIWRGVLPLWVRMLAGASLALWPGQILFSGVVAQDNWVLLPAVALGVLAVRSRLSAEPARLVTAGLLLGAGAAMRQEMAVVLFPLFLVAARVDLRITWRRAVAASLAAGLPLLALAAYRDAATGRFALSQESSGLTILGAYVPGASNGWADPLPYVASVRPELLGDRHALYSQATHLALQEALRRPGFHAARIVTSVLDLAMEGEAASLLWSVANPAVLPEALRERGAALARRLIWPLRFEMAAIQGLFLAAVMVAIRRRNTAILVLASVVLLKYGFHAVTVAQGGGRYFFVATGWELLAIALAAHEIAATVVPGGRRLATGGLAAGAAFTLGLLLFAPPLGAWVRSRDVEPQRTYRFQLEPPGGGADLACTVNRGVLVSLRVDWKQPLAVIRTLQLDPAPGDQAVAECVLAGRGEPRPLILQVFDPYAPGNLGGRMLQRVEIDGAEVYSHDIAEAPGSGWANIPLGNVGMGTRRKVAIEVKAIRPDPGANWGSAAETTFQLVGVAGRSGLQIQ